MDEQLTRVIDQAFNRSLSDYPVFCQTKRDSAIMAFIHAHDGYEFHFPCSSVGICVVDGQQLEFVPGMLTIIRPGAYHFIRSTQTAEYWRMILSVDEPYLAALMSHEPVMSGLLESWFPSEQISAAQLHLASKDEMEAVQHLLRTIELELEQRRPHFQLVIKARLLELFARLGRQTGTRLAKRTTMTASYRRLMTEVADHISARHAEPLSIDELAETFHLSKSYLHKLFKQHTGQTPHQYQMLQRINHAKLRLSEGDEPITDISLELGFGEMAYFSRCFKEATGVTPSFYRSSMRRSPSPPHP
ncbi:AraC-type DNA-binding protein [Paenibacillus sp. UNCCL117]|uniref:AraC family transcriptional regulator n=1 Tax=unclassified Paenibacillus TaxID=185978 RepID=UPI00087F735D|nr:MULTISPECIES: helix-turn-helix domain-containing protein [unclassified Paenibacillus]SDC28419.1 AraC-type DNA-binding protein [Paenibacillus sp. cl123]SFW20551.1 AraC-type DNA-binding protein [Paenibacillus sp. UNCCL117]